ncbi:MAG: hypothetical protein ACRCV9_04265 [Burkholderiaceae bacterium]
MKQLFAACLLTLSIPVAGATSLAMEMPTGKGTYDCAANQKVSVAWSDAGLVTVRVYADGKFKEETPLMIKGFRDGQVKMKAPDYSRQVVYNVKQKQALLKGYAPTEMTCTSVG